jgi:hypothetical protein
MTEWQPLSWHVFHTISLNYNPQYKDEYITFFHTFKTIIPCSMCRNHYISHVSKDHLNIEHNINNGRIFDWTIDLHNSVNKSTNRREWSYDEARNYYNTHNFNNHIIKQFIFQYVKLNFKKKFLKTEELLKMLKTIPYFHPNEDKRNRLLDFKNKFDLNRESIKNWIYAFLVILKS